MEEKKQERKKIGVNVICSLCTHNKLKVDLDYFIVCSMKGQSMGGTRDVLKKYWKIFKCGWFSQCTISFFSAIQDFNLFIFSIFLKFARIVINWTFFSWKWRSEEFNSNNYNTQKLLHKILKCDIEQ